MVSVIWRLTRRLLTILVVVFFILSIDFAMFMVIPGDPYNTLIPKGGSQTVIEETKDFWKLDEPVIVQYVNFLKHYLTGDFGPSLMTMGGAEIQDFIYDEALRTVGLAVTIGTLSVLLAVLYERIALMRSKYARKSMHFLAMTPMGLSVPALGLFLLCISVRYIPDIPIKGDGVVFPHGNDQIDAVGRLVSVLQHAFLPVLTGVLSTFGLFVLMLNSGLRYLTSERGIRPSNAKDILKPGYFVAALKSVKPMPVFFVSWVLSVVLVIDVVYSYGGLGELGWVAVYRVDYPLLMAIFFVVSILGFLMILVFGGFMALWQETPATTSIQASRSNTATPLPGPTSTSLLSRFEVLWNEYKKSVSGIVALIVFVGLAVLALLAPLLATVPDPYSAGHQEPYYPDGWENPVPPSLERSPYTGYLHPFGTDHVGRDIYSMWLYGARTPLVCAIVIGFVCVLAGYLVGVVASQLADLPESPARLMGTVFGTIGETFLAIPVIVLLASFAIVRRFGPYASSTLFALVLFSWAWAVIAAPLRRAAFNARSEPMSTDVLRARTGVARLKSNMVKARTLFIAKFAVPLGILAITMLSFYGIFNPSDDQSWGMMLESAYERGAFAMGERTWLWVFMPLVGICALALSIFVMLHTLEKIYIRRLEPLAQ